MNEESRPKYDLEPRTLEFAKRVDVANDSELEAERMKLLQESAELMNIFGAILHKT